MDKEHAREIARNAVEEYAKKEGAGARFPLDAIWQYATEEVPSLQRPGCRFPLIKEGYIEETGAKTKATTKARAGSPSTEYRLGRRFRAAETAAASGSLSEAIKNMQAAMAAGGFNFSAAEIANFYLAIGVSPLVILTGISGTGKSKLPRLFAQLTESAFHSIPVKPQWSDNSDLFGYTPSLNPDVYVEGAFTKAAREAASSRDRLHVVLLDEMNLAAVEHYFSDFLSVIETRRRESGETITDNLPLDLPSLPADGDDAYGELRSLSLPPNIRIVGTANMDETTHSFSPKVLDRAFSIEFDDPDLTAFAAAGHGEFDLSAIPQLVPSLLDTAIPVSVDEAYSEAAALFDCLAALLEEVRDILKPAGISFGYRTRNEICLYMYLWDKFKLSSVLSATAAMDFCFRQKILPKVNGTGEALGNALRELYEWLQAPQTDGADEGSINPCVSRPWERSAEKVQRMINRLEVESATTFWGT